MGKLGDEIARADRCGRDPQLPRRLVHQPLGHVEGFRSAGAPVGIHRRGIGHDPQQIDVGSGNVVSTAGHFIAGVGHKGPRLPVIRANVGKHLRPQAQKASLFVQRQFRMQAVIAPVGVAQKALRAGGNPLDGAAKFLGGVQGTNGFMLQIEAHTKATAHVRTQHTDLAGIHAQRRGRPGPQHMDALAALMQHIAIGFSVVFGNAAADFQGRRREPIVHQIDGHHMGSLGKGRCRRIRIAQQHAGIDILRCLGPNLRRPHPQRDVQAGHGR